MFADRPDLTLAPAPLIAPLPRVWRVRDIVLGFALAPVAFLLISAALVLAVRAGWVTRTNELSQSAAIAGTLAFEVAIGGVVVLLAMRRGLSLAALGIVWPKRWGPFVTAWLGAHGIVVAYTLVVMALGALGLNVERFQGGNTLDVHPGAGLPFMVALGVTAVLVAPVCEELFFRCLLYRGLRGFWTVAPALALSGLCFGLFHMNLGVLIPFTLIGALFAWSTEASGSLLTAISAHMMVNGLAFGVTAAGYAQ